jgi:hypothetical protein
MRSGEASGSSTWSSVVPSAVGVVATGRPSRQPSTLLITAASTVRVGTSSDVPPISAAGTRRAGGRRLPGRFPLVGVVVARVPSATTCRVSSPRRGRAPFPETSRVGACYPFGLTSDTGSVARWPSGWAPNAPIQGSAANLVKIAMLGVHRAIREVGLRSRMPSSSRTSPDGRVRWPPPPAPSKPWSLNWSSSWVNVPPANTPAQGWSPCCTRSPSPGKVYPER